MQMPERWKKVLKQLDAQREAAENSGLESASSAPPIDLSDRGIKDRMEALTTRLSEYAKEWLSEDPEVPGLIAEIARNGEEGLQLFRDERDIVGENHEAMDGLESIVLADGSRPSFLVQNDAINPHSSWVNVTGTGLLEELSSQAADLGEALKCVGRIDVESRDGWVPVGTGFLISPRLIMTNLHVACRFMSFETGTWQFTRPARIDFGQEYQARNSVRLLSIQNMEFAAHPSFGASDPTRLDLAILRVKHLGVDPPRWLQVESDSELVRNWLNILALGYPLAPNPLISEQGPEYQTAFDRYFRSQLGFKRVAIGTMLPQLKPSQWTAAHDASTLIGNSGSVILCSGHKLWAAAVLNSDERFPAPVQDPAGNPANNASDNQLCNYGYVLGDVLNVPCLTSGATLREFLKAGDVGLTKPS